MGLINPAVKPRRSDNLKTPNSSFISVQPLSQLSIFNSLIFALICEDGAAIAKVSTHLKWDPNSDLDKCIKLPKAGSTQGSKYMTPWTQQLRATLPHRYSNVWQRATLDRTNHSSSCTYLWIFFLSSHKMRWIKCQLCPALFFILSVLITQQLHNTDMEAFCRCSGFHLQSIHEDWNWLKP